MMLVDLYVGWTFEESIKKYIELTAPSNLILSFYPSFFTFFVDLYAESLNRWNILR